MEVIGLFGLIILVVVFLFQSIGFFRKKELYFYGFNAIGAGLLAQYAFSIPNFYFGILESIWCISAFVSVGTIFYRKTLLNHANVDVSKK